MAEEVRLVNANEVYDKLEGKYKESGGAAHKAFGEAIDVLCDTLTVDAVPVVHARWKHYHKQNIAVCTNCSFERDLDANFGKAISCPNCGATMDLKD